MKLPGQRRCDACGARWSYFETGQVACPECGELRSTHVGDERVEHTDDRSQLDLEAARAALDDEAITDAATKAETAARTYLTDRGFISGGELEPLDERYVAAAELRHVAAQLRQGPADPADDVETSFLSLLDGAPAGDRPDSVPEAVRSVRGLAVAEAVADYRADLRTWLDDQADGTPLPVLGDLRDAEKRILALNGAVPAGERRAILESARLVGDALRERGPTETREAFEGLPIRTGESGTNRDRHR